MITPKMYCPVCKGYVYPIRHVYPDRVEYVCPRCGRVLEVVHKGYWSTRWLWKFRR